MKKLLALLLTVVVLFTVSTAVFADDVESPHRDPAETVDPAYDPNAPQSPETGYDFSADLAILACAGILGVAGVGLIVKAKKENA